MTLRPVDTLLLTKKTNYDIHAYKALLDRYINDWQNFLPSAVKTFFANNLGKPLSEPASTKIQALVVQASASYWINWRVFQTTTWGLTMGLEVTEMNSLYPWQLIIAENLRREWYPKNTYSHDILAYQVASLMQNGISYAPPPLDYLQKYLPPKPDTNSVKEKVMAGDIILTEDRDPYTEGHSDADKEAIRIIQNQKYAKMVYTPFRG